MSKIQFNELNKNASELEVLNTEETAGVVGGFRFNVSSFNFEDNDSVFLLQGDSTKVQQTALGGFGDTVNSNGINQGNSANIYQ